MENFSAALAAAPECGKVPQFASRGLNTMRRFGLAGIGAVLLLAGCQSPLDFFLAAHGPDRPSGQIVGAVPVNPEMRMIDTGDTEDCRTNTLHDLHRNINRPLCS